MGIEFEQEMASNGLLAWDLVLELRRCLAVIQAHNADVRTSAKMKLILRDYLHVSNFVESLCLLYVTVVRNLTFLVSTT